MSLTDIVVLVFAFAGAALVGLGTVLYIGLHLIPLPIKKLSTDDWFQVGPFLYAMLDGDRHILRRISWDTPKIRLTFTLY